MRFLLFVLVVTTPAAGQLRPRDSVGEYPLRCEFEGADVGVEYMYKTLPTKKGMMMLSQFLVFEIGIFPEGEGAPEPRFAFYHKKAEVGQAPSGSGLVAAHMENPMWQKRQTGFSGCVGPGNEVNLDPWEAGCGGRSPIDMPGAPPSRTPRTGPRVENPSGRPDPDFPGGTEMAGLVQRYALENAGDGVRAGYVYFFFDQKLKKLRQARLGIALGDGVCDLGIKE